MFSFPSILKVKWRGSRLWPLAPIWSYDNVPASWEMQRNLWDVVKLSGSLIQSWSDLTSKFAHSFPHFVLGKRRGRVGLIFESQSKTLDGGGFLERKFGKRERTKLEYILLKTKRKIYSFMDL